MLAVAQIRSIFYKRVNALFSHENYHIASEIQNPQNYDLVLIFHEFKVLNLFLPES